jgi:alpha 1,3-glucosidase
MVDGAIFVSPSGEVVRDRRVQLPPGGWANLAGECVSGEVTVSGGLDFTPVFFRRGRIIPMMSQIGRSTARCVDKNLTLMVFEDEDGTADGDLYIDDYETREHENGAWVQRKFRWENRRLSCTGANVDGIPRRVCDTVAVVSPAGKISTDVSLVLNDDWEFVA